MFTVLQAKKSTDLCCYCGKEIRRGTVFVIKPIPIQNGQYAYGYMHLWCDAMTRGAHKEHFNGLGVPPKDARQ